MTSPLLRFVLILFLFCAIRCGAHLCWRCLGVFTADTIYPHMREAHGGLGGEYGEDPEELAEQEEILREAAEARRVAEV